MNKSIILSGPQFVHLYNGESDHHSEAYYFLFLVCIPFHHQLHHLNLKKKKRKKEWAIKKKQTYLVFHQLNPLIMWESFHCFYPAEPQFYEWGQRESLLPK